MCDIRNCCFVLRPQFTRLITSKTSRSSITEKMSGVLRNRGGDNKDRALRTRSNHSLYSCVFQAKERRNSSRSFIHAREPEQFDRVDGRPERPRQIWNSANLSFSQNAIR